MISKRAVSIMIGYVLLVTAAIVMGVIVYQWLKTYVPIEVPECPQETSVFIKDYSCEPALGYFNITLKNNGKFNVAGYFIHVANKSGQEIATIDLSNYVRSGGMWAGNAVVFVAGSDNAMSPGEEIKSAFLNLTEAGFGQIYLVEIIPTRFQEIKNKLTFVSCGNAKIRERINDASCVFEIP